jgi:hypothetical protein
MSDYIKDMFIEVREKPEKKEAPSVNTNMLLEMIEKTMNSLNAAHIKTAGYSLVEAEGGDDKKKQEDISIKRPIIKITESWGKAENVDRQIMEAMLSNVQGLTVEAKLDSVRAFLTNEPAALQGDITKIMSYLIFLDTFASIVNDYGASVTGFLFEAFLAALFGGRSIQVDDPTDVGAKGSLPIEDNQLWVQAKAQSEGSDAEPDLKLVPYSLKVLRKDGIVHGSFKNLVDFFLDPAEERVSDSIVYLVVIKDDVKGGDGEKKTTGRLKFYEFEITRETFMTLIGAPTEVPVWGYVPTQVSRKTTISPEKNMFGDKAPVAARGKHKLRLPDGSPAGAEITDKITLEKGDTVLKFQKTGEMRDVLAPSALKLYTPEQHRDIMAKFGESTDQAAIDRDVFAALKQTKGYGSKVAGGAQWSITPTKYRNLPGIGGSESSYKGDLVIDSGAIREKAEEYTATLNQGIVAIFNSLSALTDNINNYFIAGDIGQGSEATTNAEKLRDAVLTVIPEPAVEQEAAEE